MFGSDDDWKKKPGITVYGKLKRQTEKGLLFVSQMASNQDGVWYPKSMVVEMEEEDPGVEDTDVSITFNEWFTKKKAEDGEPIE